MPKSKYGKQYVLLIVDHASCFLTGFGLSSTTAQSTLLEFSSNFGWPEVIISDQGTNVTSKKLQSKTIDRKRERYIKRNQIRNIQLPPPQPICSSVSTSFF